MNQPTAEQWALVEVHLALGSAIAGSIAAGRAYLMPFRELLDQLQDAALDGLIAAASSSLPAGVPFAKFAGGCVTRKCLERVRYLFAMKRRPSQMHPLGFDPPDHRPGEGGSNLFAELVAELSPTERQVLALRFLEDMTQDEAGNVLGVTSRSIRRIESQAFERIKRRENACPVPVGTGQAKDPQTSDT